MTVTRCSNCRWHCRRICGAARRAEAPGDFARPPSGPRPGKSAGALSDRLLGGCGGPAQPFGGLLFQSLLGQGGGMIQLAAIIAAFRRAPVPVAGCGEILLAAPSLLIAAAEQIHGAGLVF